MKRSLILAAALCAFGGHALAQDQAHMLRGGLAGDVAGEEPRRVEGWRVNETHDTAYVYDDSRSGALGVTCYEDRRVSHFLTFGVPTDYGFENTSGADGTGRLGRLLRGVTIMRLIARDRTGLTIGSVDVNRQGSGDTESWSVTLSADQLAALRAASRLELQTNRWAGEFTGAGSARAISGIECLGS